MQRGKGKIRRRRSCLWNGNFDPAGARDSLRFDQQIAISGQDKQPPLGPRILHRDSYELLDQLGKNHLTGNRLRGLNYRFNVQLPRLHINGGCGRGFLAQAWVAFVELPYFSVGAPTGVAVARVAEMRVSGRFETARQIVLRRQLVGEAFVLNEAVVARQMDSLLVETQGVAVSLFQTGDLSQYQRVLVAESRWIVFGPFA